MRSFAVKFLILTLCSLNGYAAPFNGGPGGGSIGLNIRPDIRPNIRPGERGSNIQEALGSSQNQYSPLNPGSNQSVFLLNNFISQQFLNDSSGGISVITFNPINPLPSGPFERDLQSETLPLVERDLASNFILMPSPKPFAPKVAKSRTQGMVFVTKSTQPPEDSTKLTAAGSQGAEQAEQAINNETQLIEVTFSQLRQTISQIATSQLQFVSSIKDASVAQSSANEINVKPPPQETSVLVTSIENQVQLINQQIQEQLSDFDSLLQTTEQTLGGMSQPISSGVSGSK